MKLKTIAVITGLICGSLAIATAGHAKVLGSSDFKSPEADLSPWKNSISAGVGMVPKYSGSKNYRAIPLLSAAVQYNDYKISLNGLELSANLIPSKVIQAGPVLAYSMGRNDDTGNDQVDRLTEVKKGFFGGGFVAYNILKPFNAFDKLTFKTTFLHDINGHDQGYIARLNVNYATPLSRKIFIITGLSTTYGNKDYMQSFYGVTPQDATRSGLTAYNAKSGIKDAGAMVAVNYLFNKAWSSYVMVKYTRLLGSAKDSSIVQETGTPNQFFVGTAISYRF